MRILLIEDEIDMARYLMGCEVEEIYVAAAVLVDPAIGAAGDVGRAVASSTVS